MLITTDPISRLWMTTDRPTRALAAVSPSGGFKSNQSSTTSRADSSSSAWHEDAFTDGGMVGKDTGYMESTAELDIDVWQA